MQLHARPARTPLQSSFRETAGAQLAALCDALRFAPPGQHAARGALDVFLDGWGDEPVGPAPRWRSDITDDHSPYEFSLAFTGGGVELRFLVEAQPTHADPTTLWQAAGALSHRLERERGADLDGLRSIEDLFAPAGPAARFAAWHAVNLTGGGRADFKVYLNPQVHGPSEADAVVDAALRRLGRPELTAASLRLRGERDELRYFSLDLDGAATARLKIYVAHHDATAAELERAMSLSPGHVRGDATHLCRAITGRDGPLDRRPALTCYSFVGPGATPAACTLHFPVRSYAADDREARDRILELLGGEDRRSYAGALAALAARRLEDGVGLQTYLSIRREGKRPRVTIYLSPELYAVTAPRREEQRP